MLAHVSVAFDPGDATGIPPWRKTGITKQKLSFGFRIYSKSVERSKAVNPTVFGGQLCRKNINRVDVLCTICSNRCKEKFSGNSVADCPKSFV